MNLDNSIVIVNYPSGDEYLIKEVDAIWGGSDLTLLERTTGGGVEIREKFTSADRYTVRAGKHRFASKTEMLDSDGDVVAQVTVLPQGPGCRPCGT